MHAPSHWHNSPYNRKFTPNSSTPNSSVDVSPNLKHHSLSVADASYDESPPVPHRLQFPLRPNEQDKEVEKGERKSENWTGTVKLDQHTRLEGIRQLFKDQYRAGRGTHSREISRSCTGDNVNSSRRRSCSPSSDGTLVVASVLLLIKSVLCVFFVLFFPFGEGGGWGGIHIWCMR